MPQKATYSQIMHYLINNRKAGKNTSSALYAIKSYYDYLLETNQRDDHPARSIYLKDKTSRDIQLQDLFSRKELESLLDRKERYAALKTRNQVIIGLLIYQALSNQEIIGLQTTDIDLEKGIIHVRGTRRTNGRSLKLQAQQIMILHKYLHVDRPKMSASPSDQLILNKLGKAEKGEQINYLTSTYKDRFKDRKLNPVTIRQSVIANLLKEGKDLRVVQVFAGHKTPSTTEKYRQSNIEALKTAVVQYHPLG